jgi:type VI secretion system protein ImpF
LSVGDYDVRVTASLLDRLLDDDPRNSRDGLLSRPETVRRLKRAVVSDLEQLLNARNSFADLKPEFVHASRSVLTYGLADFTGLNVTTAAGERQLRDMIETAIQVFEPRLMGVSVTILPASGTDRSLRLRVDARLILEPVSEPIAFDVIMPTETRGYHVRETS